MFPLQFIWSPYLGLEHHHEINEEDVTVWTATTLIIRFTTVEMHHSDHVKM